MNSLNIITARVSPAPSPATSPASRSGSISSMALGQASDDDDDKPSDQHDNDSEKTYMQRDMTSGDQDAFNEKADASENTPLLDGNKEVASRRSHWWHAVPRSIASGIISSIRWVFATIATPGVYLVACFYDENGNFAPMWQLKKLFGMRKRKSMPQGSVGNGSGMRHLSPYGTVTARPGSSGSSSSGLSSESESEEAKTSRSRHTRSKSLQSADENSPQRRSIRIKLHNEDAMRERKHRKTQSAVARTKASDVGGEELSAQLKSPTSPIAALTRYPRTPAPPRPLIPRRQPSYLNIEPLHQPQKTLILDLDETLIHSMSKGGRMSTGHMVEVRLNTASLGLGGGGGPGPAGQHPILYWVNKRPYCDEFLRRVCKWFNLVIFTASVQEYADPVIDWLESERKFFSARYYRQHCTYRQGTYIKDLSSVEPDLSKVMILDNSPLSYLFHEDNAIPIQGWINDPTDNDLMHLVPLLEGLQYVHDVRAFLALRGGEDGQSTA